MAVSEIKTMLQSAQNTPSKIPNHMETSQSTSFANQLAGWVPHNTSLYQRYFQAEVNGTFQGIKQKRRKPLVRPESYSEPSEFFIRIVKIKSQYMQSKLVIIYIYIYIYIHIYIYKIYKHKHTYIHTYIRIHTLF